MFTNAEDKLSDGNHVWHGTAVVWHSDLKSMVTPLKCVYERFSAIKIRTANHSVLAISVYFPTAGKDDEFLECVSILSVFIKENSSNLDTIIIGADSNCSDISSPRRINAMNDFINELSLVKVTNALPTFHHHNGRATSCIDYFLVSNVQHIGRIMTVCTKDQPLNLSTHDIVHSTLKTNFPIQEKGGQYVDTYSDFIRRKIIWDEEKRIQYDEQTSDMLRKAETIFDSPEFIPLKCELYSNLMVKSAELCFDFKLIKSKKDKPIKFSRQVEEAKRMYLKCYRTWKDAGKPSDKDNESYLSYVSSKRCLQTTQRSERNLDFASFNDKLMECDSANRN